MFSIQWKINIFKSFCFSLANKRSRSRPKIPAPAQILNRLRLQPKNLGSDRLRNTAYACLCMSIILITSLSELYFLTVLLFTVNLDPYIRNATRIQVYTKTEENFKYNGTVQKNISQFEDKSIQIL